MPKGAEVLTVQVQNGITCIWVLCNPDSPKVNKSFEIFGTGHSINEVKERRYIGTFQLDELVYHLFELLSTPL